MEQEKPFSIAFLLSSWLSASMIFISGEVIMEFGALGGLVTVFSFFLSFSFLITFMWKFQNIKNTHPCRLDHFVSMIFFIESFIMQALVGSIVFKAIFQLSIFKATYLYITLSFILMIVLKSFLHLIKALELTKLTFIFILAIILPNYIYLQKGLETVYHNLLHYHPRVLHFSQVGLIDFFLASMVIFIVKLYLQLPTLKQYFNPLRKEIGKLIIVPFAFGTIILAFSTMTIVAITEKIKVEHLNEHMILVIKELSSDSVFLLVALSIVLIAFITMFTSYVYLFSDYTLVSPPRKLPHLFLVVFSSILSIILIPIFYNHEISVLQVFLFFGAIEVPIGVAYFLHSKLKVTYLSLLFIIPYLLLGILKIFISEFPVSRMILFEALTALGILLVIFIILENKKEK